MVNVLMVLTILMTTTGMMMKYNFYLGSPLKVREVHDVLSPFFGTALVVMAITGYYMYLYTRPRKSTGSQINDQNKESADNQ